MLININTIKDDNRNIEVILEEKAGKMVDRLEVEAHYSQAEKLLPLVEKILNKHHLGLNDLKSIKVQDQGGSFTSLRIGVITANALGYALGIPVIGQKGTGKKSKGIYLVEPKYSGKPNITKKSSR